MHMDLRNLTEPTVRGLLGTCCVICLVAGLVVENGALLLAASALLGTAWWVCDLLMDHIVTPFLGWMEDGFVSRSLQRPLLLTVDNRIRILERRLANAGTVRGAVAAGIRLAEIYEFQKRAPDEADRVLADLETRHPGSPQLQQFVDSLKARREAGQHPPADHGSSK